jgi:hypothetical protein
MVVMASPRGVPQPMPELIIVRWAERGARHWGQL